MDIALIIIWIILTLWGIIWCLLPVLPGPLLTYIALVLLQIADKWSFSMTFLLVRLGIVIAIIILDYFIPIIWTKKMWWTKRGTKGATVGLIIWIIVLPILWVTLWPFWLIWIIGGPFVGAYIWEKIHGKSNALKSAFWSFLGFLAWTFLKLAISIIMTIYFFKASYHIISNIFQ